MSVGIAFGFVVGRNDWTELGALDGDVLGLSVGISLGYTVGSSDGT